VVDGLEKIRVIQTATVLAGPMAARLLADWGAEVIRVERPVGGDMSRQLARAMVGGGPIPSNIDYVSENINRNKQSIALDLAQEQGQRILHRLLSEADVLLCNFRPRELTKFQLTPEVLSGINPKLIIANLSGYGPQGPDRDLPGYEGISFFSRAGIMHTLQVPGMAPPQYPIGMGDFSSGLALAYGIMLALFIRERTGVAQAVDTSLFQTGIYMLSNDIAGSLVSGLDREKVAREDVVNPLAGYYETQDQRWVRIGMVQPDLYWSRFCRAIDREALEHDPRFAAFEPRIDHHDDLFMILVDTFKTKTYDEWKARLTAAGLPWGPVQNAPEVATDAQARANDMFTAMEHPEHGRMEVVNNPVRLSKTPPALPQASPVLGQHTEAVLRAHGYTPDDIEALRNQGIIG
jgi:crotonobetainyl-CoA:carnitine CoA-transferase CaiB-like acyl-CoA transferase